MGMAASQARLLALTSRMHDIELRAQNLESQKLSLATQEDAAYQKYCDALDAKKIQVARIDTTTSKKSYIDANFSTVCGYQEDALKQYSLINNLTGKVIVPQEIKDLYERYGNDSYIFAWAAMGFDNQFGWGAYCGGPYENAAFCNNFVGGADVFGIHSDGFNYDNFEVQTEGTAEHSDDPVFGGYGTDLYMTEVEFAVFLEHYDESGYEAMSEAYRALLDASKVPESISTRKQLLKEFRDELYKKCGEEIKNAMLQDKNHGMQPFDDPDVIDPNYIDLYTDGKFSYYQNLWEQINKAGGCETIDEQYVGGDEGTEWFNNMVSAGLVSIYMLDTNNSDKGWELTTIATSVGNNYLQEVNDEEKAKKAEAEYEHEMKIINRKDTKFDTALKKLETEENACKTEIESIKKVKDENIERTFNLFS